MNGIRDLALMLGDLLTTDQLLDELQKAMNEHNTAPTEKTLGGISFYCTLLLSKLAAERKGGMDKLIDEVNQVEAREKLFNPDKR